MERKAIITLFAKLGDLFSVVAKERPWPGFTCGLTEAEFTAFEVLIRKEYLYNPWFTKESVLTALGALSGMLESETFEKWTAPYPFAEKPKRVAIIMAGNIPLVGFHDLLAVVLSGHIALCKLSSGDTRMLPAIVGMLEKWEPEIRRRIELAAGPLTAIEAVIATGSNNATDYFDRYFGKYPHIFRRNRTSVAVLDGTETKEELQALGNDMFRYFGLGCRNVSKLLIPENFELNRIFEAIVAFGHIINHHKYANNYDYNRTIYLMNRIPFLDNNFCMLKEDEGLVSPLSVFFVQRYADMEEVAAFLEQHKESIQTVVGHDFIPLGKAQEPAIDDYADGVNTLEWLSELK